MPRRHRRGEGTVFFSKLDRRWIARFPLGGGRFRRVKCRTRDDADYELERMQRTYGAGGRLSTDSLDEYLAEWLAGIRSSIKPTTFVSYSGHVRMHISPLLGGIQTSRLTSRDVRRLIADREQAGLKASTIRRIVTTLQMALAQGVREGSLAVNVASGLRLPRAEPYPIRAMTFEDADAIVEAVRGDRFEALYVLLLYSGMRLGEAVSLTWADVDLDGGTVYVRRGKTRAAARIVPLADIAREALWEHRRKAKVVGLREPVFVGPRRGKPLRGDVVTHAFPRLLERAGLPRMRVHDLRHGTATMLLAAKVPARDIADLLGHASPSVTMNVYMHVTEAMRREAVNALNFRGQRPVGFPQRSRKA
jgi:integrase